MNCKKIRDFILTDYLDQEMSPEKKSEVEGHISACAQCREFADNAKKALIESFEKALKTEPEESIWQNISARIYEDALKEQPAPWWVRLKALIFLPRPAAVWGVSLGLILVVTLIYYPYFLGPRRGAPHEELVQEQAQDIAYVLDELAMGIDDDYYEETGIEEYFL